MGQYELVDFLKQNPGKYFDARTLSRLLKVNRSSVSRIMKKMYIHKNITMVLAHTDKRVMKYCIKYEENQNGR